MALFNHATKEVTAKLVYYGPGLCGKTTNLQWIHDNLSFKSKGNPSGEWQRVHLASTSALPRSASPGASSAASTVLMLFT